LSLAISIICFISSALGAVVVEVVAGLDAVVVVVVVAGLEVVGAFGAADGVWAIATEAIANRVVTDKVIGLMCGGDCVERDGTASSFA
jgi:hypothetical protein